MRMGLNDHCDCRDVGLVLWDDGSMSALEGGVAEHLWRCEMVFRTNEMALVFNWDGRETVQ